MLKNWILAIVPVLFVTVNAFAGDDILADVANLKSSSISDASISIETAAGALDVDALAVDAGKEKSTDAIEACFHGYGHNNYGHNSCYSNYNYCQPTYNYCQPSYNYCQPSYNYCQPTYNYCQPSYSYCQPTYNYCQPSYNYCQPSYNYWGCR